MDDEFDIKEARVTYTTKELLHRIDERLDRIESVMVVYPNRSEFDALSTRVDKVEEAVLVNRTTIEAKTAIINRGHLLVGSAIAVAMVLINIISLTHILD